MQGGFRDKKEPTVRWTQGLLPARGMADLGVTQER